MPHRAVALDGLEADIIDGMARRPRILLTFSTAPHPAPLGHPGLGLRRQHCARHCIPSVDGTDGCTREAASEQDGGVCDPLLEGCDPTVSEDVCEYEATILLSWKRKAGRTWERTMRVLGC